MTPFQCVIITDSLSPRSQRETAFGVLAKDVVSLTGHSVETEKGYEGRKISPRAIATGELDKNSGTLFPYGSIDSYYL